MRGLLLQGGHVYLQKYVLLHQDILDFYEVPESGVNLGHFAVLIYLDYVDCVEFEERLPPLSPQHVHCIKLRSLYQIISSYLNGLIKKISLFLIFKLKDKVLLRVDNLEKVFEVFHVLSFPHMDDFYHCRLFILVLRDEQYALIENDNAFKQRLLLSEQVQQVDVPFVILKDQF